MNRSLKIYIATLVLISASASLACAQAAPASTMSPTVGPGLPSFDGIFHYALRASDMVEFGNAGSGTGNSAVLSGDAAYNSTSVVHPFSMVYAGGLLLGNQYGGHVTTFQNLSLYQGLVVDRWNFGIADSVSYLPQTPTLGLSGIPGVGDLGSQPVQGASGGPAGGALTNNATNVSNALSGNIDPLLERPSRIDEPLDRPVDRLAIVRHQHRKAQHITVPGGVAEHIGSEQLADRHEVAQ